jgi:ketosteroid isomerase-like protein
MALTFGVCAQEREEEAIQNLLNAWHKAAADADFDAYFGLMSREAVFVGTDATEHWDKEEFMAFSKPYFDKGKAWAFTPVERHIYFSSTGETAWFDELLDTWMELCRGSGVLIKEGGQWKVAHYVLSMTIPNDRVQGAVALKKENDSIIKKALVTRTEK